MSFLLGAPSATRIELGRHLALEAMLRGYLARKGPITRAEIEHALTLLNAPNEEQP